VGVSRIPLADRDDPHVKFNACFPPRLYSTWVELGWNPASNSGARRARFGRGRYLLEGNASGLNARITVSQHHSVQISRLIGEVIDNRQVAHVQCESIALEAHLRKWDMYLENGHLEAACEGTGMSS
jgi:hypothetical protein